MAETVAVELRGVSKQFGTFTAVDNVSLKVEAGEFFSLLGPSGCGKTTNLRMIAGFELPTAGEIYLHGEPVGQLPPFKRNVNTVFQNYALFPHLNVYQNIAFGLEMKKVPAEEIKKRVEDVLDLVHLPQAAHRKPSQLSGGMKQRVALARALVNQPKVLLLDEPLGALDFKLRKAMQFELKELQRQLGITFIFVTHDQEEALVMSDRIGVMSRGHLLQVGSPTEIYDRPTSRFVADFIGDTNFVAGVVKAYEAQDDLAQVTLGNDGVDVWVTGGNSSLIGQEVTVTIRPEKIYLHQNVGMDGWPARVVETTFLGTDTLVKVALPGEVMFEVRQQNSATAVAGGGQTPFHAGDEIKASWDTHSARLLVE